MTRYLVIAAKQLDEATTDLEAAKLACAEECKRHGATIGDFAVIEYDEMGRYVFASPFWDSAAPFAPRAPSTERPF